MLFLFLLLLLLLMPSPSPLLLFFLFGLLYLQKQSEKVTDNAEEEINTKGLLQVPPRVIVSKLFGYVGGRMLQASTLRQKVFCSPLWRCLLVQVYTVG